MDKNYCTCNNCSNEACGNRLTDEVAEKLATFGLPVSIADESKICRCFVEKTDL